MADEHNPALQLTASATPSPITFDSASKTESASAPIELARMAFEKIGESGLGTLTKGLEATTKAAERGVVPYLLGAGTLLVFFCLALKMEVAGHKLSGLSTGEFVTVLIVGGLFVLSGAGIRLWTYASEHSLRKDELTMRLKILETTAGVAEKGMKTSAEIAQSNAGIATLQLTTSGDVAKNAVNQLASKVPDPNSGMI